MGDHLVLCADRMITSETLHLLQEPKVQSSLAEGSCSSNLTIDIKDSDELGGDDDDQERLIQLVECRICQEEDSIQNLETPCSCCGSLKFAHRKCVQRWCNEKGDTTCEICHQPYQSGYTAPPPVPHLEDTIIDIRGLTVSGTTLDLHDPRLFAMAAAEQRYLDADYDDYADTDANGAAFCRSAALILVALVLLRHSLSLSGDDDDDASTFFALFLLRAAGFLLPCYIMAWAISVLQRRRQRQQAAETLAAADIAFMVQARQRRGLQFAMAPGPAIAPNDAVTAAHQDSVQ